MSKTKGFCTSTFLQGGVVDNYDALIFIINEKLIITVNKEYIDSLVKIFNFFVLLCVNKQHIKLIIVKMPDKRKILINILIKISIPTNHL